MRDEDDDLRAALHRERLAGDSPFDARAAFAAVQPRLARARRRRTAARSAAAAVLLLVGSGITLAVSGTSDQEIHMSDSNTDRTSGPTSVVPRHADAISSSTSSTSSTTTPQSGVTTSTTATGQVALPTTTARAATADDDSDDGPDDDSNDPPTPGGTAATTPPSPVIEPSTSAAPTTTVEPSTTTSTTSTTSASTTSTSTTSTTAPLAAPELFTCECGSALVDRSTGAVVVLQVDAHPGYSYRLEHLEEDGSQTIEFTGVGEECELRIPVSGRAQEGD